MATISVYLARYEVWDCSQQQRILENHDIEYYVELMEKLLLNVELLLVRRYYNQWNSMSTPHA